MDFIKNKIQSLTRKQSSHFGKSVQSNQLKTIDYNNFQENPKNQQLSISLSTKKERQQIMLMPKQNSESENLQKFDDNKNKQLQNDLMPSNRKGGNIQTIDIQPRKNKRKNINQSNTEQKQMDSPGNIQKSLDNQKQKKKKQKNEDQMQQKKEEEERAETPIDKTFELQEQFKEVTKKSGHIQNLFLKLWAFRGQVFENSIFHGFRIEGYIRKYVKEVNLFTINPHPKRYLIIDFELAVIYMQKNQSSNTLKEAKKLFFRDIIDCYQSQNVISYQLMPNGWLWYFMLQTNDRLFILFTKTQKERDLWINAFQFIVATTQSVQKLIKKNDTVYQQKIKEKTNEIINQQLENKNVIQKTSNSGLNDETISSKRTSIIQNSSFQEIQNQKIKEYHNQQKHQLDQSQTIKKNIQTINNDDYQIIERKDQAPNKNKIQEKNTKIIEDQFLKRQERRQKIKQNLEDQIRDLSLQQEKLKAERENSENKLNSLKISSISYDNYEKIETQNNNDQIQNCYGLKQNNEATKNMRVKHKSQYQIQIPNQFYYNNNNSMYQDFTQSVDSQKKSPLELLRIFKKNGEIMERLRKSQIGSDKSSYIVKLRVSKNKSNSQNSLSYLDKYSNQGSNSIFKGNKQFKMNHEIVESPKMYDLNKNRQNINLRNLATINSQDYLTKQSKFSHMSQKQMKHQMIDKDNNSFLPIIKQSESQAIKESNMDYFSTIQQNLQVNSNHINRFNNNHATSQNNFHTIEDRVSSRFQKQRLNEFPSIDIKDNEYTENRNKSKKKILKLNQRKLQEFRQNLKKAYQIQDRSQNFFESSYKQNESINDQDRVQYFINIEQTKKKDLVKQFSPVQSSFSQLQNIKFKQNSVSQYQNENVISLKNNNLNAQSSIDFWGDSYK